MSTKSFLDCERNSLERMKKYQLPHSFKRIGIIIAVASFAFLFVNKFTFDSLLYREFSKYGILIGLLIVSISKEKIEDELISKLRMQSFTFAFIIGVVYTFAQPFANYVVDFFIDDGESNFKDTGDFEILWMLLSIQVFYFAFLKRAHQ